MKVAVLHNVARGGALRRLAEQVHHLDAEVVEICLGTSRPFTERPIQVPLELRAPSVPRAMRAPLRYADLAALLVAWRRAAAHARRCGADVVFANPCRFLQAPAALLDRHLPPALYFCDEPRRVDHEAGAAAMRNPRTQRLYAPLYAAERRIDAAAVMRAGELVTNSRYTAGAIATAYGRTADPVRLGVVSSFFAADAEPAAAMHVLSVGMLTRGKGHDLALRAVAATGGRWPLLVVAPRPEPEEEVRLRELAAELDVGLEVRVGISDEELGNAYAHAQATLYLARAEPLGLVSLEAQARGCPVIVSDEGGLPETVDAGRSGFVVAREGGAAAQALTALEDSAVRSRMAAAARAHAATFTWERSAAEIQARLEHLAA
jgi:glycosyltransferase involved in cell wall biosynthesis